MISTSPFKISFFLVVACLFLEFAYAQSQNINLAFGKNVIATSTIPEYPASNVVDGKINRESKWMSAVKKAPHILEINLEAYCNIEEIHFYSGIPDNEKNSKEQTQANGFFSVKNFKIQYWDDANWTDFPNASILENREIEAIFKFDNPISTYRIRMVADDGEQISVMEIEVLGNVAPDMPAPPSDEADMVTHIEITEDQQATLKANDVVTGRTFEYVGYNQGYFLPGYNVSGWLEYSGVNSIRLWPNLSTYVPESTVQVDASVNTVIEFDRRKEILRLNPEKNKFINWNEIQALCSTADFTSNNNMVLDYAIKESQRLGIKPLLQINSRDFDGSWSNKWQQWQRYYAIAYHTAKTADVHMFAMQNEPNHRHSGPMKLDQWIEGMQIVSDAVHAAIEDVNNKYGKTLTAKFVGPVTAGQNTDWWATIAKNIRTDYHGDTLDYDLIDVFSTHSYNSPAAGYSTRVKNIRKILMDNHPENQDLPIVFTEIGRWMNAYLIDKEETMDSPSLFTEWAGIYSNNMKNSTYGMWAFKLVNNTSSSYPRGIKSGHHLTWQGSRFVEDAHENLADGAAVSAYAKAESASKITDGDKSDESSWESMNDEAEKWIEIDLGKQQELGSALIYTGSEGGVFTAPDRIMNFRLQSWKDGKWTDIPETVEKENRYAQVYIPFEKPITIQKIRFISNDPGVLKVREIKLFDKNALPNKEPNYNISGIQRTGEVVRLFAKGFKAGRDLLEIERSTDDTGLDTYISFDAQNGMYYMWLIQRGLFTYDLDMDLSALNIIAGSPVVGETVDAMTYGEASTVMELGVDKHVAIKLSPQSVTLLSLPAGNLHKEKIITTADSYVTGGMLKSNNNGSENQLKIRLDAATPQNNEVSYISFSSSNIKGDIKKVLLNLSGMVDTGNEPYRLHVYAIPNEKIDERKLNWYNAPYLSNLEALVENVGDPVKVAGELAFTTEESIHHLDVTDIILKNKTADITFMLVRETRELGDDADKGRTVRIKSKESNTPPNLTVWKKK